MLIEFGESQPCSAEEAIMRYVDKPPQNKTIGQCQHENHSENLLQGQ